METQNIILTVVIGVFLYVVWNINRNMYTKLELISKQVPQPQKKQSTELIQTHPKAKGQKSVSHIQNDLAQRKLSQEGHMVHMANNSPEPYELYMGKHQYLNDKPHRQAVPQNDHHTQLFDRELQHMNIPGGIMQHAQIEKESEPEGVLTSLAGAFDGTMVDGVVHADNILQESYDDIRKQQHKESCNVPSKTSEQCVNKMIQQTGCYNCSLKSCALPGSSSEQCHSRNFVG